MIVVMISVEMRHDEDLMPRKHRRDDLVANLVDQFRRHVPTLFGREAMDDLGKRFFTFGVVCLSDTGALIDDGLRRGAATSGEQRLSNED